MNWNSQSVGSQNKFHCNVCKINFSTEGEYALHEFSKKHCDNLLKISKNKPNKNKAKEVKVESLVNKEKPKINVVTNQEKFTKYGHFVFGETYISNSEPKVISNPESNSYLEKHAESSLKEISVSPKIEHKEKSSLTLAPSVPFVSNTCFKRIKKECIRICEICNVTFSTISDYESHLKSSDHSHSLKMTGMGVSAQFVRPSSDLDITEMNKNLNSSEQCEQNNSENMILVENSTVLSKIYCDVCELSLNSKQQYNAHVNGKPHNNLVKKKVEVKDLKPFLEKSEFKKMYCYTCKLLLNNLRQYNDHKNGKKHKMKCRKLMKKGIRIPFEEMVESLEYSRSHLNEPVTHPDMYQKSTPESKTVNSRTDTNELEMNVNSDEICSDNKHNFSQLENVKTLVNAEPQYFNCKICNLNFVDASSLDIHVKSQDHQKSMELNIQYYKQESVDENDSYVNNSQFESVNLERTDDRVLENTSRIIFHTDKICSNISGNSSVEVKAQERIAENWSASSDKEGSRLEQLDSLVETTETTCGNMISVDQSEDKNILNFGEFFKCTLCCENFIELSDFENHLSSEEHAKKIQESKNIGIKADDIIQTLLKDRTLVKPDKLGRHTCSICGVTAENLAELIQHQSSILHQRSKEDFKKRKRIEITYSVNVNHEGQFVCKACQEGYATLVNYNKHLHTVKHKDNVKRDNVNKMHTRNKDLRQKRLIQMYALTGPRKKDFNWWRRKCEKNLGMRAKMSGNAKDLHANPKAGIPGFETKTCPSRNVSVGVRFKRMDNRLKHYGARHAKNPNAPHLSGRHSANLQSGNLRPFAPLPPHAVQHLRYSQPPDFLWGRNSNSHHFGYW